MASERNPMMSVEAYFELEENHPDTRYEYLDGYVYMMSGGSANHATISGNILLLQPLREIYYSFSSVTFSEK